MRKITMGAAALLCLFCLSFPCCFAQQQPDPPVVPSSFNHAVDALNNQYSFLGKQVQRHAEKVLRTMEKRELSLQQQLQGRVHGADSVRAAALFTGVKAKYAQMLASLRGAAGGVMAGVAMVSWGFTMDSDGNVKGIGDPTLQLTNKFTPQDAKIVSSAYPNYSQ